MRGIVIGGRVGPFLVTSQLGEGGMGVVFLAEHDVLRTRCAMKVLLPQWTQNALIVQRFVNEARAAASIRHRNIIAVHDCGQLPDGRWYIVMDHLDGTTLTHFCASRGGPLPLSTALKILAPIANGLEAAHAAGIIHRDLKPDNIFLTQYQTNPHHPIILDFGIAKLGEQHGGSITRTGMVAGTPAYMAPEQMRDLKFVDRRSDVYALGVIAYQMVTGGWFPHQAITERDSYDQLTAAEIYHRQQSAQPIDPRVHAPELPSPWAAAILGAIHPDPSCRPQTARAFALLLAQATAGDEYMIGGLELVRTYAHELLEVGVLVETLRSSKGRVGPPLNGGANATTYATGRRSTSLVITAAIASCAVAGALVVLALDRGGEQLAAKASPVHRPTPQAPPSPETPTPVPVPSIAPMPKPEQRPEAAPGRPPTRPKRPAPQISKKPPDAGAIVTPVLPDTNDALHDEWQTVHAMIARAKAGAPRAADAALARWRCINIMSAMTSPTSRKATFAELATIRAMIPAPAVQNGD